MSSETPDPEVTPVDGEHSIPAAEQGAPVEIHPPHAPIHTIRDFAIQLVTITAGVLIALSFEGLREWNHYRTLVNEAQEMIHREMVDNKKEVEISLNGVAQRQENLNNALQLAEQLLANKTPTINQFNLGLELAELSSASWQTAERTGALAHMGYTEVQEYSRLYSFQDLYAARQRQTVEQLVLAIGLMQSGPTTATPKDLELFRQRVMELRSTLEIERQLGQKLVKSYEDQDKRYTSR